MDLIRIARNRSVEDREYILCKNKGAQKTLFWGTQLRRSESKAKTKETLQISYRDNSY